MKLISIKAHGFKSFADKIEIQVGGGITGIVGPNGSGKSNVVDAVKWVLGEQSLKELRGGESMSDVIFAGSSSRMALTRAWVSLTFDNTDHYLATDLAEVEIKRVVYATGENEYFINNARVRKKDITDLFIDSGANAGSFSIISQGKISEVLKGKPSDRRSIIEEAAGVLKYKKRKEETMRKLDNTNDNLERVNLIIDELETNLDPLRKQAEAAVKYIQYKDELKEIEIALLARDIKDISETSTKAKNSLSELNELLLNIDNSSSVDNTTLEKLKNKNIKLDEKISEQTETLMQLSQELAELETKKRVISERKKYEVDNQKLENNILLLKENEINFKKSVTLLTKEISTTTEAITKSTEEIAALNDEYRVLTLKKSALTSELNSKNRDEVGIKNKLEVLTEAIENDTKLPYAVKSVLNNPRLKGIHDVLCKLIETEEDYVKALETALGSNANVIIVDDEVSGKEAINYLKDNKLGRATFFPISIIKPRGVEDDILKICVSTPGFINVASNLVTYNPLYKAIILNQLGNTLVVNNIDTMNILGKKIGYRYRIITLDGEILHTGGSMSGGINKASNGILNNRFEFDKLQARLEVLVNEAKLLEEHINQIDNELKLIEDKLFNKKGKMASLNETKTRKNIDLEEKKKKLAEVLDELLGTDSVLKNETDKEFDKVMDDYLKVSTKKDLTFTSLQELKTNKNDLTSEINELELQNRKVNSEYNKYLTQIKDLEVSLGKMDIKLDNYLNRLSEEYGMTYEKASSEYVLDIEEETARTKVNHLKRSLKDLGDVNVGSIAEYERINTRYTFLSDQKSDLENAINDLLEIIVDLDETMKTKFKETFDKVNAEFMKVFKHLFKGGRAELILTDTNDLLATGIDIIAEPPGKSLKSINTLSGGEMTLTAIALLFSILNIRVVPFCILDEVEAALDEANVDTFGTYIKEYENTSQFIVITHKKRTMEYVNTLYGITMQESGVSKLVSVRLENIAEN